MAKMTALSAIAAALVCAPVALVAQNKAATYITKEQVDTVNKQPGTDRTIRVLDIGHENFAVGIIHRGPTGGAARGAGAAPAGARPQGRGGAARRRPRSRAARPPAHRRRLERRPGCTTSRRPRATTSSPAPARW